jgi:SAM-dependent methyltransferase
MPRVGNLRAYERSARYYDLIYEGLVDYDADCDFLEEVFHRYARTSVGRVLDLGCGTGNHAIRLASRGYEVLGVDISEEFVRIAKSKAREAHSTASFIAGSMEDLRVSGHFDAIISMFGAVGYVRRSRWTQALRRFAKLLSVGGLLVFEFWNVAGVKPGYRSWLERQASDLTLLRLSAVEFHTERRVLDLSMKHYILKGDQLLEAFEEVHHLDVYSRGEMRDLLRTAGLKPLAMLDGDRKTLEPAPRKAFRIMAVARR